MIKDFLKNLKMSMWYRLIIQHLTREDEVKRSNITFEEIISLYNLKNEAA